MIWLVTCCSQCLSELPLHVENSFCLMAEPHQIQYSPDVPRSSTDAVKVGATVDGTAASRVRLCVLHVRRYVTMETGHYKIILMV